jgi:hypothetical protein
VNGPEDIKKHAWFKGCDWEAITNKEKEAPFMPSTEKNYSNKNHLDS